MDCIFAAAAAKLGSGPTANRFLQTRGARHVTSWSSGAASSSSGAAASSAAVTHPRDGLQRYSMEEWDAKVERYCDEQFQQCSKDEWAAWHADGPKRKEAKVDKTEEEEVAKEKEEAKVEETYEEEEANVANEEEVAKEEVANEEEVAKEEDVAKEEAEEEAREEKQVLAAHDPYEPSSEAEDSLEALRMGLHDAQPNPEPCQHCYWQGFYDGRASRWQEEAEEEDVAKEEAKSFGVNEPPPPFHVYRSQKSPPPPPPPIPQPSEAAREAAVAEFDRRVFGGLL